MYMRVCTLYMYVFIYVCMYVQYVCIYMYVWENVCRPMYVTILHILASNKVYSGL